MLRLIVQISLSTVQKPLVKMGEKLIIVLGSSSYSDKHG